MEKIGLSVSTCPMCNVETAAERNAKRAELLKALGYPDKFAKKVANQRFCDLHVKRMFKIRKMENAERIFKVSSNNGSVRVHFGYRANGKRSTLLLVIKPNGKMFIVANSHTYDNISYEFLNLFSTNELQIISSHLQKMVKR